MAEKELRPIYIVTGLSGAGKTTALRAFEDLHYFTVDGLPASLAAEMAAMSLKAPMRCFQGMAIGMDLRQDNFLEEFNDSLREMSQLDIKLKVIFLEANDQDLIRRYAATRRPHPMERSGFALREAIARERESLLIPRGKADLVIDSSGLSIHELRRKIQEHIQKKEPHAHSIKIILLSFGYKYGVPSDTDFIFDLRFLPNPYFVEELRPLSGKDKEIVEYIFNFEDALIYINKIMDLLGFILPFVESEGRSRLTVALGCTGGRHRSVAFAEKLGKQLKQADYPVMIEHRHLEREAVTDIT